MRGCALLDKDGTQRGLQGERRVAGGEEIRQAEPRRVFSPPNHQQNQPKAAARRWSDLTARIRQETGGWRLITPAYESTTP